MCSGAMKLWPIVREYSTAASNTRFVLIEKGMRVADEYDIVVVPAISPATSSPFFSFWLCHIELTASRAFSRVMPEPRNPFVLELDWDCASATRPSSRC